jgi:hypothetical protein
LAILTVLVGPVDVLADEDQRLVDAFEPALDANE